MPIARFNKSSSINGLPALEFDGSNDSMQGVDVAFTQITILAVAKFTKAYPGSGWRGAILSKRQVNPNNNVELYFQWGSSTGTSAAVMRGSTDGTSQFFAGADTDIDTWYLLTATYDGSRNRVYSGGFQQGQSGQQTGILFDNASSFFVGRDNTGSADRFQGQIAEVIMFNRNLEESERVQVECYLGSKYALYTVHACY